MIKKHWRFAVFLAILDLSLLASMYLMTGGVRKLTDTIWTGKLVAGCEMDFRTSVGVVALACPGEDYFRLWPLPVVHPWFEHPDPRDGWIAERGKAEEG